MDFMERLDGNREEKRLRKRVAELMRELADKLSAKLALAPEGRFANLSKMRTAKGQRAYIKAMAALEQDDLEEAMTIAVRGLLHLEIAHFHDNSPGPNKTEKLIDIDSQPRESIARLSEALCQFKQLVEYRNLDVPKEAQERLGRSTQYLQNAIEAMAAADDEEATAQAEAGLVFLSFTVSQVVFDPSEFPRALLIGPGQSNKKDLTRLMEAARTTGTTLAQAAKESAISGWKAKSAANKYIESALNAFLENNGGEVNKYLELIGLETGLVQRTLQQKQTQRQLAQPSTNQTSRSQPGTKAVQAKKKEMPTEYPSSSKSPPAAKPQAAARTTFRKDFHTRNPGNSADSVESIIMGQTEKIAAHPYSTNTPRLVDPEEIFDRTAPDSPLDLWAKPRKYYKIKEAENAAANFTTSQRQILQATNYSSANKREGTPGERAASPSASSAEPLEMRIERLRGIVDRLNKLGKHTNDPSATASVLEHLKQELETLESAAESGKWQAVERSSTSIHKIRREFKSLLKESDLL
ncbi:MAG: hypothetical protein HY986_14750 [Candidatus Melainabacteria bacterium]|nr:hypothetical protein [Candidatus Melainabacteria bacterium]